MNDYNLIWEEKGIMIGIIHYLVKNINMIKTICIEDKMYFDIIKNLFPNLKIHNKYKNNDDDLINISIKSSIIEDGYLILNNLNNLKKIRTKKEDLFLLPWFNVHNPIIMFKYNEKKKKIPAESIREHAYEFNNQRINNIMKRNIYLAPFKYKKIFWDVLTEYNILKKYADLYNINVDIVARYLYANINSYNYNDYESNVVPLYVPMYQNFDPRFSSSYNYQNIANQQNTANQQNAVNQQNIANQQNTANQQNAVNQQNIANQQMINQQMAINRDLNVNIQLLRNFVDVTHDNIRIMNDLLLDLIR